MSHHKHEHTTFQWNLAITTLTTSRSRSRRLSQQGLNVSCHYNAMIWLQNFNWCFWRSNLWCWSHCYHVSILTVGHLRWITECSEARWTQNTWNGIIIDDELGSTSIISYDWIGELSECYRECGLVIAIFQNTEEDGTALWSLCQDDAQTQLNIRERDHSRIVTENSCLE